MGTLVNRSLFVFLTLSLLALAMPLHAQTLLPTCPAQNPHGKVYLLKAAKDKNAGFLQNIGMVDSDLEATFDQDDLEKFNDNAPEILSSLDLYLSEDEYTYDYERLRENILSYVKFEYPFTVGAGSTKEINAIKYGLNYFRIDDPENKILGQWVTQIDTDKEEIFVELVRGENHFLFRVQKNLVDRPCYAEVQQTPNSTAPASTETLALDDDNNEEQHDVYTNNPEPPTKYVFEMPIKQDLDDRLTGYLYGGRLFGSNNSGLKKVFAENSNNNNDEAWPLTRNKTVLPANKVRPQNFYTLRDLPVRWNNHIGTDVRVPTGTEVLSIYPGKVFAIGYLACPGYTLAVEHQIPGHKLPVYAVYKHLSSRPIQVITNSDGEIRIKKLRERADKGERIRNLQVGDAVAADELVAFSGGSGMPMSLKSGTKQGCISNPHLHFEIRVPKSVEEAETLNAAENKNLKMLSQKRLSLIETKTLPVNPADYIEDIDRACYEQKVIEIENAQRVEKNYSKFLPQLSAGLCSQRAEISFLKHFSQLPRIYQVHAKTDIPIIFPEVNTKPEVKPKIQKAVPKKSNQKQTSKKSTIPKTTAKIKGNKA